MNIVNSLKCKLETLVGKLPIKKFLIGESHQPPQVSIVDKLFDNATRNIGHSKSRRQAIKYTFAGMVGAAFYNLGIRASWADNTCLCNGRVYDPDVQCCTVSGVQNKNPISDLDSCPNRVPHPGHTCISNGCGAANGQTFPNNFGAASILHCCNDHDCCYGECKSNKGNCDNVFEECMTASCDETYPGDGWRESLKRNSCRGAANTYWAAVATGGQDAYNAAQRGACDCCESSSCGEACAGGSCGALPACEGGADCVCFTSVEGEGACVHGATPCAGAQACSSSSECPPGYACLDTTCCGSQAVCGPICNVVNPASSSRVSREKGLTFAG